MRISLSQKSTNFYTRCHVLQNVLFRPSILNRKKNQTLLSLIPVSKNAKKYILSISNMCVDACSSWKVLFQEPCQEECPDSDPLKVHLPATHVNELNLTTFANLTKPINAFVICAKECPSNFVRDNGECYVECSTAEKSKTFNLSCIRNCPE